MTPTDITADQCRDSSRIEVKVTWTGGWFEARAVFDAVYLAVGTGRTFGQALANLGEMMTGNSKDPILGLPGKWKVTLEPIG
jgi:hypothetical protein